MSWSNQLIEAETNGRHFGRRHLAGEISLKSVPKGPINNIAALVQIMAWRRARRQAIIWTNDGQITDAYMRHSASMS